MLRPYLAILRDSFRAAVASRVLYVAILLIVVVLVLVSPFHLREVLNWKIDYPAQMPRPGRLVEKIVKDVDDGDQPMSYLWGRFSESLQSDLRELAENPDQEPPPPGPGDPPQQVPGMATHRKLVQELNSLMEEKDLYDEQAWSSKRLPDEAKELLDRGIDSLGELQLKRLNRLLIDAALGRHLQKAGNSQLEFYYLVWRIDALTTTVTQQEFANSIANQLPFYFDKIVMSVGIFIAILVTASIIPDMLEPGSLNLLLSKPIYRWALLLTKFIGGGVFMLVCSTLFFGGVWLWLGIQFMIWDRAILISIPVYVLVFLMYYSVSVFVGIWFRSAILAVVFTLLFWCICFGAGALFDWFDNHYYNVGARQLVTAGDDVLFVDQLQTTHTWNENDQKWETAEFTDDSAEQQGMRMVAWLGRMDQFPDLPGPIYDPDNQRVYGIGGSLQSQLGGGKLDLIETGSQTGWRARDAGQLPSGTVGLFDTDDGMLAVTNGGMIFLGQRQTPDDEGSVAQTRIEFERITTLDSISPETGEAVSWNASRQELAIYSRGRIALVGKDADDNFTVRLEKQVINIDNLTMAAFLVYRSDHVFLAMGNGRVYHYDAADLSEINSELPENRAAIRSVSGSPDGRWLAVVYRSRVLWLYDAEEQKEHRGSSVRSQGDVLAADFDPENRLWVFDLAQTVTAYEPTSMSVENSLHPKAHPVTTIFMYILRPFYWICPKPGEFYTVIAQVASASDTKYNPEVDLTELPQALNPWSPLKSGIIFMAVMLAISCLVFQRMEF